MKKTAFTILLALLVSIFSSALALGQRVFDEAGLFSATEESQLQNMIESLYDAYDTDLVIVTASDTKGKSSRAYADDFYDNGDFGTGEDYTGALLLINMQEREPYISTSGYMIDVLNDRRIEAIFDAQYDYLVDGKYAQAMSVSLNQIERYLASGPVAGQYREAEDKIDPFSPMWLMVSIGSGLLVALIASGIVRKSYKKDFKYVPYDYAANTTLDLSVSNDTLVDSRISKQYIPPQSSNGGGSGGGRSTTHTSSSGRTHGGGGGRKF